eukprot:ANDGO_04247.mRNA.1 hypothetical protein
MASAVFIEGELEKQGGSHKNWKKRFFRVSKDGIAYFKNATDSKPIRVLELNNVFAAASPNADAKHPFCFVVFTTQRDFNLLISCETENEVVKWVTAIRIAREKHFGKQLLFGSDEAETVVSNNMMIDRETHLVDRERSRKIQEFSRAAIIEASKAWSAELVAFVNCKRLETLDLRKMFIEEIGRLRQEATHAQAEAFSFLASVEEQADSELVKETQLQAAQLRRLAQMSDERIAALRSQQTVVVSTLEEQIQAMRSEYESQLENYRAMIHKQKDDIFEYRQKALEAEQKLATEKQVFEEILIEKELERAAVLGMEKSITERERGLFESSKKSFERVLMARTQLMLSQKEREIDAVRQADLEERDRLVLKARFGQDLKYDDGQTMEFFSGRALAETSDRVKNLLSRVALLEEQLVEQRVSFEKRLQEQEQIAVRKEAKMNEALDAYKRQLDTSKNLYDGQVGLLKDSYKQEILAYRDEISRLKDSIAQKDRAITDLNVKLSTADTRMKRALEEKDALMSDMKAQNAVEVQNSLADARKLESELREQVADKTHELTLVNARKEKHIADSRQEIERRVHAVLAARYDGMEKMLMEWKTLALQNKALSSDAVTDPEYDYSTVLAQSVQMLGKAIDSEPETENANKALADREAEKQKEEARRKELEKAADPAKKTEAGAGSSNPEKEKEKEKEKQSTESKEDKRKSKRVSD